MSTEIERAERELFGEALACEGRLPAEFHADGVDAARALERAESLLRSIALIEDGQAEESEERGATELALQRIEARLNLLLELVGALARGGQAGLPVAAVRWSRRGLVMARAADAVPGQAGWVRMQPAAWLPQTIDLPVEVAAVGDRAGEPAIWLRFAPLPEALESALERHLFRQHRRAIADARRQR